MALFGHDGMITETRRRGMRWVWGTVDVAALHLRRSPGGVPAGRGDGGRPPTRSRWTTTHHWVNRQRHLRLQLVADEPEGWDYDTLFRRTPGDYGDGGHIGAWVRNNEVVVRLPG